MNSAQQYIELIVIEPAFLLSVRIPHKFSRRFKNQFPQLIREKKEI